MTEEIDKEKLYGRYQKGEDARSKLAMKMAHKALDIPIDDMDIKSNTTTTTNVSGIGTKGALGIAAAAGLPGLLIAALLGLGGMGHLPAPVDKPAPPAIVVPIPVDKAEYEAVFQVKQKDGTWKEIRREPLKDWKP